MLGVGRSQQVMSILNLDGKITMAIQMLVQCNRTVDSGIAQYNYILPAQTK